MAPDRPLQLLYFESLDFWTKPAAKSAHVIVVVCFRCALVAFPFQLLRHYIAVNYTKQWTQNVHYSASNWPNETVAFCVKLQKRITNLCRICGQSNPTDFFFVFWNYVHCHQNIQCIINTTPDILLVIIWRVQRLTIRFLEIIWMHLSQYFGDFSLHFVESYLFNQFISNLIVSGGPFFLHFFTNFHRKMTQPFAAAISVPSAPHKALYWLTVCRKNSRFFFYNRTFLLAFESSPINTYVSFLMPCELFKIFVFEWFVCEPESFPICTMRAFWPWFPSFSAVWKKGFR